MDLATGQCYTPGGSCLNASQACDAAGLPPAVSAALSNGFPSPAIPPRASSNSPCPSRRIVGYYNGQSQSQRAEGSRIPVARLAAVTHAVYYAAAIRAVDLSPYFAGVLDIDMMGRFVAGVRAAGNCTRAVMSITGPNLVADATARQLWQAVAAGNATNFTTSAIRMARALGFDGIELVGVRTHVAGRKRFFQGANLTISAFRPPLPVVVVCRTGTGPRIPTRLCCPSQR